MKNTQIYRRSSSLWDKFLDLNPQLFREVKGKLKTRNIIIAAALSAIAQFIVVIYFLSELPKYDPDNLLKEQYGRYAMGVGRYSAYTKDMLGNWIINWQLLWLDIFMALSIIGIFSLLVVGTYMLVTDTVKEDSRGTLNFIRLTPQSAGSVLLGKMLGVPVLLYIAVLLLLPLHMVAGLGAHIPIALIIGFDAAIVASCALCYSLALLWSLTNFGLSGFKPWLAGGAVGFLLTVLTTASFHDHLITNALWDWLLLFNPGIVLAYLIEATSLSLDKVEFVSAENLGELLFYGQALWTKASFGIGFILFNFSLWTYWSWSALKRRFHNPTNTLLSKTQSYWITGWLVIFALGFTLQNNSTYISTSGNFIFLQLCFCALGLALIAALSPHRQGLYDWARYRHQINKNGNVLWKELVFGENSPSGVALFINMAIAITYITPSIFLFLQDDRQYSIFWGFVLSGFILLLYGLVAQLILTLKTRKRSVWSAIAVISMIIVPPTCLGFAGVYPDSSPQLWLFSFLPTIATEYATMSAVMLTILGQALAISLVSLQTTRILKQAGKSSTKLLFESEKVSR